MRTPIRVDWGDLLKFLGTFYPIVSDDIESPDCAPSGIQIALVPCGLFNVDRSMINLLLLLKMKTKNPEFKYSLV